MPFFGFRRIEASPARVFAAFESVERLAVWWGPAGFRNSFAQWTFEAGARWSFVMHGPDGRDYANEMILKEFERPKRIVMDHLSEPRFLLTVTFDPASDDATTVGWLQEFDNATAAKSMAAFLREANEQVFDRLEAEVLK